MHGVAEEGDLRRLLDDVAAAHHGDRVGDVVDDREVVGHEEVGEPERLLQILEQVQDLRLHGDVERRDGLVADQHARLERQRAGDAEPLPLPAGEGMRIAPQRALIEPDHVEQLLGALVALVRGADVVDAQGLGQDLVDGHARIERRERVLEHELHGAAIGRQRLALEVVHVLGPEPSSNRTRPESGVHGPHDRFSTRWSCRSRIRRRVRASCRP